MNTPIRPILAAALFALLSACGNKGPLVLPDSPDAQAGDAATTDAVPATDPSVVPPATTEPVSDDPSAAPEPATTTPVQPQDPATGTPVQEPVQEDQPAPAVEPADAPPADGDDGDP